MAHYYNKLDQLIIENIKKGNNTISKLLKVRSIKTKATNLAPAGDYYGLLKRRLQTLKGKGLIAYSRQTGWRLR